jgi:hypothetical protein
MKKQMIIIAAVLAGSAVSGASLFAEEAGQKAEPAKPEKKPAMILNAEEVREKDAPVVGVTAPERFSAEFNLINGLSHFYDLSHDPDKKKDIGPGFTSSGIFWCILYENKNRANRGNTHDFANPPLAIKLLEHNDVRVRVELPGHFNCCGLQHNPSNWNDLDFVQTWTVYPDGNFYLGFVLHNNQKEDCQCSAMDFQIQTTAYWNTLEKGGVKELAVFCENAPTKGPHAWMAQSTNGPTFYQDIALILSRGRYYTSHWDTTFPPHFTRSTLMMNEGYNDEALFKKLPGEPGGQLIPPGDSRIAMLYRFATDMKSQAAVQPYALDYRAPSALKVTDGEVDKTESGDENHDGFNEEEGCYVLKTGTHGVVLSMDGTVDAPRHNPVFKVKSWQGGMPETVQLNGKSLQIHKDYNAALNGDVLLVQLFTAIDSAATVRIGQK